MSQTFIALLALAVYVLAATRLTLVVTSDKITDPFRAWMVRRYGRESPLVFLVFCTWCTGWWVTAVLAWPATLAAGLPWWWGFGLWPAGAYLVGVFGRAYPQ